MPDRTTKVTLTANISQYVAGMEQAALKTKTLGDAASKLAAQRQAFSDVGRVIFAVGALAAAGVALAIKEFADFDAKLSQVQSLSRATSEEMNDLSDAALHLGQSIGFTANEVADAEIELVKAGVSVKDQLGGALKGALELAAAGQIDVADATEIATVAMTQFALKGKDVPHVADLLAAGADKALGSVDDLGEALKSGGLVASQFGVSLDETVGTLSAFANAGLIGETAGTDLRQLLLKLANPAKDAADAMDTLGISIYDQQGKFVGLSALAGELSDKLKNKSEADRDAALATIFGSRAIAGANVLYKEGADGIKKWTDDVDDSGFAAEQAAGKMDNLNGDLSKLGAAFQTAIIESGSSANDILRTMTQDLTVLVSGIGDLPTPVLGVGLALTGLVAVVGLVGGGALLAVPKIAAFKDGLTTLGISGKTAASGIGLAAGALTVATIAIGYFAQRQADAVQNTQEFKDSLNQATGATTEYTRSLVAKKLADSGAFAAAKEAGISQRELTDAVLNGGDALDQVNSKLTGNNTFATFFTGVGIRAGLASDSVNDLSKDIKQSKVNLDDEAAATDENADSTLSAADAYKSASDKAEALNSNLNDLIDTINKANGVGQDAVSTNAAYQGALGDLADYVDKARKKVDGYSLGVDENTASGSKNVAMLADLARQNEAAAQAQFKLDSNTDTYTATLTAGHQAVVDNALALGATADQAQAIADKVAAIPTQTDIQVLVDSSSVDTAQAKLDALFKAISVHTSDGTLGHGLGVLAPTTTVKGKSAGGGGGGSGGGLASGGYTGDYAKDAVVNFVHGQEFVVNANGTAVSSNRAALEYMNAGGDISRWNSAPAASNTSGSSGTSITHGPTSIEINEVGDPVANANAVLRRLNLAKA